MPRIRDIHQRMFLLHGVPVGISMTIVIDWRSKIALAEVLEMLACSYTESVPDTEKVALWHVAVSAMMCSISCL
jgi:hypothetical protein